MQDPFVLLSDYSSKWDLFVACTKICILVHRKEAEAIIPRLRGY